MYSLTYIFHFYKGTTASSMKKKTLNLKDLFVEPNFDESKTIALNSKGRLKRLSKEQLDSIRKTGEFEVRIYRSHFMESGSDTSSSSSTAASAHAPFRKLPAFFTNAKSEHYFHLILMAC